MAPLTLAASKRLRKELQVLRKSQAADPEDDILLQHNPENLLLWKAWLKGASSTPYEGGVFQLDIRCGVDYPLSPPTIKFVTRVFHPNVHFRTGDICLDILKKEWSPAWGLQAACRAVLALVRTVVIWRVVSCHSNVSSCVLVCWSVVTSLSLTHTHPLLTLYTRLFSISQLSDPDADSPLNCDAGNMIRGGDAMAYHSMAAMYTVENANFTAWPPTLRQD
jgi:peroxin-4